MHGTLAALVLVLPLQIASGRAEPGNEGLVVAAPHGGYDTHSELVARDVARRLDWGWVTAIGYRSVPLRHWFDVNRPTERPWVGNGFGSDRETARARRVHQEYQDAIERAGRRTRGRQDLLVEIHGHSRSVSAGGRSLRVQVIELATEGFTRAELETLKRAYDRLVQDIPAYQRVDLAIDRLDRRYAYAGWLVPFYFYASGATQDGSLSPSETRRALHFELPPRARESASARAAYARLLAQLLQEVRRDLLRR